MRELSYKNGQVGVDSALTVGRQRELELLSRHLNAALSGRGGIVLISGEAGIGKSTVVNLLDQTAASQDVLVLSGGCYDLTTTPPYGPWIELANQCPAEIELPTLLRRDAATGSVASQDALFDEARDYFATLSASRPTMLVLEDLHWSDQASLELLRYVARHVRHESMLVVATYRADEVTPQHALYPLLPLLVREADAERVELRQLDDEDVRTIVDERYRLPAGDASRLAAYLIAHTEGNPLFIHEVLRTLEGDGLLWLEQDNWTVAALDRGGVPPLIHQLIAGRVGRLSEETRELLAVAAVIGHEVPVELWSQVAEVENAALLAMVEEAIAANFVYATPDGTAVRFVHALVREAIYDSILPIRRRPLHEQVAEQLATARLPDPDAVADHFQRAADPRAIEWLIAAGDRAYQTYAWRTAIDRFQAAAQLIGNDPERAVERGWLLYRTGRMLRLSKPEDGVECLLEAERVARTVRDDVLAAYALADRGLLRCFTGDIRRGIDELATGVEALDGLPADHLSRDPLIASWIADALRTDEPRGLEDASVAGPSAPPNLRRSTLALWLAIVGRNVEAIAIGEAYRHETAGVPRLAELAAGSLGDAMHALGFGYAELGRRDDANQAFNRAREIYRSFDHHELVCGTTMSQLWLVICPYFATDLALRRRLVAEAEAARARGHGASGSSGSPVASGTLAVTFLAGWWVRGREVIGTELEQPNVTFRSYATAAVCAIAWGQGDDDFAWQLIHKVLVDGPHTEPGDQPFAATLVLQSLAVRLALDHGNLDHARVWLEAHGRWLVWGSSARSLPDAELLWARYHHLSGDADAARHHAVEGLRLAGDPAQPLTLLAAHRFVGQLDAEAGDYADADQHLQEALALARACAAPFEQALTLLALAELRAATGATEEAHALVAQVREICLPLAAKPTLACAEALSARLIDEQVAPGKRFGLTGREIEVLRLVAQGLTDLEVAEQLFISPRTVSSHLTGVYTKLDVRGRAAATRFAVEHELI